MNLDHFLDFWSHYNQTIIQTLIVVTLIFIVALVFITLFGSKNEESGAQVGLSPELEKSLQKMLDNQTKAAVFDFTKPQDGALSSIATHPTQTTAELEKMKAEVSARDKKIQDLNAQLSQALSQSTSDLKVDTTGLEARIKELEARLAEYDIISEDIADLSRYKEENEKIKTEIASLRSGAPAAVTAAAVEAIVPAAPKPAESAPEIKPPDLQVVQQPETPAAAAQIDSAAAAVDDDLMKEFAAAVEGQKAATQVASVPTPGADNEDLMGQFENFVQKKEGS